MFNSNSLRVYGLVSGSCGLKSGVIVASDRNQALTAFCRLHSLIPAQVAVLYSYPLSLL